MVATRKSRKNNPSTLPGFWKCLKELVPAYLEKYPKVVRKHKELLEVFLDEVNASQIPSLVYENFVLPYFREIGRAHV